MTKLKNNKSILIVIVVIILVSLVGYLFLKPKPSSSQSTKGTNTQSTSVVKASAQLDKVFEFNATNQKKEKKKIKFTIQTIERKDEIKVKGETRISTKDNDFLLMRIEIENSTSEKLAISPSDLVRIEDERGKLFAPEYHNGAVIIEPLSVRKDLMSFVVNKKLNKFIFHVGELDGQKEKVEVNF